MAVHAAEEPQYQLIWADEFEQDGELNSEDWTFERGFVRNRELQWYQPQNAFCEKGLLVIEGRKERSTNPEYVPGDPDWRRSRQFVNYTSASVTTRDRHSWQYGRFEVRARIQTLDGLWPAIWFLGIAGNWPSNGEIDLMEYYQGDILANVAWGAPSGRGSAPVWRATKTPVVSFGDPDWDDRFHIWRMEWSMEKIEFFLDDQLLNSVDLSSVVNPSGVVPQHPFHQPHYLLLNLAIGGKGGDPSNTEFPSVYEIDYVRIYERR